MIVDIEQTIRNYLPEVIHLSLATSLGNKPWICEVHFAFDDDLNLYFRSTTLRRHSQEIAVNNQVAGNIIKQHFAGQKPRGVYFEGTAELLENVTEDSPAYKLYSQRFGTGKAILDEANLETGHKFYKITVSKFYVFDAQESSPSQKYELNWNV
jgi:uncharacterized protein YhbP (UPF0306 family)